MHFKSKLMLRNTLSNFFALLLLFCVSQFSVSLLGNDKKITEEIHFDCIPEWVKKGDFSYPENKKGKQGAECLLYERQVYIDKKEEFTHVVNYLNSTPAVQNHSTISIEYDPSYQSISLHDIAIWRKKEKINKQSTARMELIQPETESGHFEYNGKKELLIFLDDVKKGDIIEFSYTRKGQNPVFQGKFDKSFFLSFSTFIKKGNFSVFNVNKERSIKIHTKNADHITIAKKEQDGVTEWSWQIENWEPRKIEEETPSWHVEYPIISFTEFADWHDVALWGTELFHFFNEDTRGLEEIVNEIKKDPSNEILHAIRFVQDDIRYLAFEFGSNSHKPRSPSETLRLGYGDCKDKTALLMAILKLLGIESTPVLVNTYLKEHLKDWNPSPFWFNHVILQIKINEKLFWIDPTSSHQGGDLLHIACHPYQKGLLLHEETIALSNMPKSNVKSTISKRSTFEFCNSEEDLTLETQHFYTGLEADNIRNYILANELSEISEDFLSYFSKRFGKIIELSPIQVDDDRVKNVIKIITKYKVENCFEINSEKTAKTYTFQSHYIQDNYFYKIDKMRKTPLAISYPCNFKHKIFLINNESPSWGELLPKCEIETEEFAYSRDLHKNDEFLCISYSFCAKKDHVSVDNLSSYIDSLDEVADNEGLVLTLPIPTFQPEEQSYFNMVGFGTSVVSLISYIIFFFKKIRKI